MNRSIWVLGLSAMVALGGLSCEQGSHPQRRALAQPPPAPPAKEPPEDLSSDNAPRAQPVTALLSLLLFSDGSARFDDARLRPIAFGDPSVRAVDPRAAKQLLDWASSGPGAPSPGQAPLLSGPAVGGGHALVVMANGLAAPLRLSLDLGWPGEGGGDVADRWHEGGVILRAPYYGPGTRYLLVRRQDDAVQVLASTEVDP